jgi:uncharacterized protein YlzI (FlbEa/FlbD family)
MIEVRLNGKQAFMNPKYIVVVLENAEGKTEVRLLNGLTAYSDKSVIDTVKEIKSGIKSNKK